MTSLLVVTVTESNDAQITMKYVKKWTTGKGKRRIRESCVKEALLRHPNYLIVTAKWEPDLFYHHTDNSDIIFEAVDLDGHTVLRWYEAERHMHGTWDGMWKLRLPEHEAAEMLTALRGAGLEVGHAVR